MSVCQCDDGVRLPRCGGDIRTTGGTTKLHRVAREESTSLPECGPPYSTQVLILDKLFFNIEVDGSLRSIINIVVHHLWFENFLDES